MVPCVTATLADDSYRMRGGRSRCTELLKIASLPGKEKSPGKLATPNSNY